MTSLYLDQGYLYYACGLLSIVSLVLESWRTRHQMERQNPRPKYDCCMPSKCPQGIKRLLKHLLRACTAKVTGYSSQHRFADQLSLTMAEALVEPDENNNTSLILEKADTVLAPLEKGDILGTVATVDLQIGPDWSPRDSLSGSAGVKPSDE